MQPRAAAIRPSAMFNSGWATGLSTFSDFTNSLQKIKADLEQNIEAGLHHDQRQRMATAQAGMLPASPPEQGGKMATSTELQSVHLSGTQCRAWEPRPHNITALYWVLHLAQGFVFAGGEAGSQASETVPAEALTVQVSWRCLLHSLSLAQLATPTSPLNVAWPAGCGSSRHHICP